jgi:hypothetical protein
MKQILTIKNTTQGEVADRLKLFFSLDFRNRRDYDLHLDNDSLKAKEVFRTSPLLLVVHIVLTLISFGLWIIVWLLIEINGRLQLQKVHVDLIPSSVEAGTIEVRLTGSDSWVQTTEAYIRRSLGGK